MLRESTVHQLVGVRAEHRGFFEDESGEGDDELRVDHLLGHSLSWCGVGLLTRDYHQLELEVVLVQRDLVFAFRPLADLVAQVRLAGETQNAHQDRPLHHATDRVVDVEGVARVRGAEDHQHFSRVEQWLVSHQLPAGLQRVLDRNLAW